jgi:hypothetical protein
MPGNFPARERGNSFNGMDSTCVEETPSEGVGAHLHLSPELLSQAKSDTARIL